MQKLQENLQQFIAEQGDNQSLQTAQLRQAFQQLLPPILAPYVGSVLYDKKDPNIILVYTSGSIYKAELEAEKEFYRLQLTQLLRQPPAEPLREVRFLVNRRTFLQQQQNSVDSSPVVSRVEPRTLSAEEDRHAREIISGMRSEELKQSLYKAMKTDLEWKKGKEAIKKP